MSRNNIQLGANGSFTDQSRGSATGLAYNDISQISQFLLELNDAHFSTNITHINTTVTAFEISSTGNVSADNKKSLTSLHKFCTPGIKLSTFIKNISSLSIYSSYHIWLCRNDPVFVSPSYLPAPFM